MPGLVRGVARTAAVVGTATAVSGRVARRQQNKWAAQDQQAAYQEPAYQQPAPQVVYAAPPAPEPEAGLTMDEKVAQLKQVAELRDAGILTDAEFEVQKAAILAG
ncbi:MAG TPA: SHOCT domain-containing protein [Actinotalea sp.]|nr:SHOCT domain-containing protein [Actinotalea sp.]